MKKLVLTICFVILHVLSCNKNGAEGQLSRLTYASVDTLADALKYLVRFGYLKDLSEVASLLTPSTSMFTSFDPTHPATSAMRIAFAKFQEYAKLPISGEFDAPTKAKMNSPRCGNKDIIQIGTSLNFNQLLRKRKRRWVAGAFTWQKRELTYRVTKFSESRFSSEVTLKEVDYAFELWGNVTNLFFIKGGQSSAVDIEMKFARGVHGDVEPFDGRGITLAHAFPPGPEIGGDIHFDDDEDWSSKQEGGTNFQHVVVHELGHALGLRHSDVEEAIMYAFARSYEPNLQLHEDDIEGIQSVYGKKSSGSDSGDDSGGSQPMRSSTMTTEEVTDATTPTTLPNPDESDNDNDITDKKPDLCKDSKIAAITSLADGSIYAFKGNYAFKLNPNGKGIEFSEKLPYVFFGGPTGPINAALTYEGKTYLFKGDEYWRFANRKLDGDFPRKISQDFPGIPNNIDAAFVWIEDNEMYFFKGDKYWGFNPLEDPPVGPNYPLPLSQWLGLPSKDIDAVFTAPSGPTYFFQGDKYWLFDTDNFQVAEADPPYPYSLKKNWFSCTEERPGGGALRRGFLRKAVDKVTGVVKGVVDHVDYKVKKITSWLPIG